MSTAVDDFREDELLSTLFAQPDLIDDIDLQPDALRSPRHSFVFAMMRETYRNTGNAGLVDVVDQISRLGDIDEHLGSGGLLWLAGLNDGRPASDVHSLVRQIRESHQRRRLQAECRLIAARVDDPTEDVAALLRRLHDLSEGDTYGGEITALSAAELDAGEFPLNYLISGVLVDGQPCVVAAPKKSLKTNTMIDMTLSLASGAKFLDTFYVPEAVRVAIISGESGAATIQETARRIAKSKPWRNLADYGNAFFGFDLPKLTDPASMLALRRFIERHQIRVLIVDPAYLCLDVGDDAKNIFSMGQQLLPLSRLSAELGVTVVIVHHFKKGSSVTETPPELEDITFAGFIEWARQWILLSRRSTYDPDQPGHHELWLAAGGSAGHSVAKAVDIDEGSREDTGGRRWEVSVAGVADAVRAKVDQREQRKEERQAVRDAAKFEKNLDNVRQVLQQFPEGVTYRTLRGAAHLNEAALQQCLDFLKESGEVQPCDVMAANKQTYQGVVLSSVATLASLATVASRSSDATAKHISGNSSPL